MNGAKTAEQNTSVKYPLWPTSRGNAVYIQAVIDRRRKPAWIKEHLEQENSPKSATAGSHCQQPRWPHRLLPRMNNATVIDRRYNMKTYALFLRIRPKAR